MAIGENPRKIAADVAEGLITFNSGNLRRYAPGDLKIIVDNLNSMQATIRQEIVGKDDPEFLEKTKTKNRRMGRIRNALTVLRAYVHRRSIKGVF